MRGTWLVVVIGLVVASPALAVSKGKLCKQQCGGLIDACSGTAGVFGFGDLAKSCKKSVLKRCKQEGGPETACAIFCGNGATDAAESCDGADLGGATCESLGFASGTLACALGCGFDTSGCVGFPAPPTEVCGNQVADGNDECDGADLGGADCASEGFVGGELACTATCELDTGACDPEPVPAGIVGQLVGTGVWWQRFESDNTSGFFVEDAGTMPVGDDAFDDFWGMEIDAVDVNPAAPMTFVGNAVRGTLAAPAVTLSALEVAQQYTAFVRLPVLRVILSLTNPTAAPVSVTARTTGNYGSDSDTTIEATSSGDTTAGTDDRWAVTSDDETDTLADSVVVTVFAGPGTPSVAPSVLTLVPPSDDFLADFPVTVPPNATRRLMFFSRLDPTIAGATSGTAVFDDNTALAEAGLLGGLSEEQLGEIVNWDLVP